MTQERAEQLALDFLVTNIGNKLKIIGSRMSSKQPDEWNVLFETVDREGQNMDGPTIVIVHEQTEIVRFF